MEALAARLPRLQFELSTLELGPGAQMELQGAGQQQQVGGVRGSGAQCAGSGRGDAGGAAGGRTAGAGQLHGGRARDGNPALRPAARCLVRGAVMPSGEANSVGLAAWDSFP